jgi:arylsulfatase A
MTLRHALVCLFAWGLLISAGVSHALAQSRPNIIFILADDIGIDGIGCYGSDRSKSFTPHLDQLAASGIRFDRCYSTPLCGPTRCLINTGRYGFRTGGLSNGSAGNPSYRDEPSLARILKQAGYATGMAGKWRQMSDLPGDWGFDEYITDPTASGWFWRNTYTKNGQQVTTEKEIYYPDVASDFAVDFFRRHRDEPFYFYLAEHLIHGPILNTPDSKSGADHRTLYDDNVKYLDKTVGKIVAALEQLGLREKTLILFSADNGTSKIGYTPEHDPQHTTGKIGGRAVNGMKGSLLEGGSRVALIANWKGTTPAGVTKADLIDFSDLLPTFAEVAGAALPSGIKFDGRSFAPQLRGQPGNPRSWIYVQLGNRYYVRDQQWKLTEQGALFDLKDAPFVEQPVAVDSQDAEATAARQRLQAVLAELNPGAGKVEKDGQPAGKKPNARKKAQRKAQRLRQNKTAT